MVSAKTKLVPFIAPTWSCPSEYSSSHCNTRTTDEVETAMVAALKNTVTFLLQNRHDETNASTAARRMANSPPYKSSTKKMKVSETAMCDLKRGILIVESAPTPSVRAASKTNFRSKSSS